PTLRASSAVRETGVAEPRRRRRPACASLTTVPGTALRVGRLGAVMQATRARTIALVSVGLLTLTLGCGSPSSRDAPEEAPTASRTPTARDTTLLPSESPPGFHIARVQLASADEGSLSDDAGRLLTLYGDPDLEDPATGPLL